MAALEAAGLPSRRIYDLRHSFATWALDAGLSIFDLSRYMGTSVEMIDRTYGHLAQDTEESARARLDAAYARRSGHEGGTRETGRRGKGPRSRMHPRAGDGARTHDPQLGKLMLYQLSYAREA